MYVFFKTGFWLHLIINDLKLHFYHSEAIVKAYILLLAAVD